MSVPLEDVVEVLKKLSRDVRELDVGSSVDRHCKLPALQFLRDYVASNKPVVLTDVVNHWPALTSWTNAYLCTVAGDAEVTVALTPNGRADAVTLLPGSRAEDCPHGRGAAERSGPAAASRLSSGDSDLEGAEDPSLAPVAQCGDCFALPHQVKLPLRDFLALLRPGLVAKDSSCSSKHGCPQRQLAGGSAPARPSPPVPYLQYQNSSLTAELPQLLGDVDPDLSWASEAFGGPPEALNLWIGDQRSITSWHKDPFENIYAVVAGSKTFSLMPPGDAFRMRLRRYPQATYQPAAAGAAAASGGLALADVLSGSLRLEPVLNEPAEEVLWSSVPPPAEAAASASPALDAPAVGDLFSEPSLPPPLRVTVQAGEVLYLPAMWWHQVEQEPDAEGRAIAVNYWYDMKFDARYAYLGAVERLAELAGLNQSPPPPLHM